MGPVRISGTPGAAPVARAPARTGGARPAAPARRFIDVVREGAPSPTRPPAAAPTPSVTAARAGGKPAPDVGAAARGLLERAATSEKQVDAVLRAAASGKTFTPG